MPLHTRDFSRELNGTRIVGLDNMYKSIFDRVWHIGYHVKSFPGTGLCIKKALLKESSDKDGNWTSRCNCTACQISCSDSWQNQYHTCRVLRPFLPLLPSAALRSALWILSSLSFSWCEYTTNHPSGKCFLRFVNRFCELVNHYPMKHGCGDRKGKGERHFSSLYPKCAWYPISKISSTILYWDAYMMTNIQIRMYVLSGK